MTGHDTALGTGLSERIARVCRLASEVAGGRAAGTARAIRERLEEPLRVAIAGRVKAGKSTLLNALVGERLAATDAGECTRIVTWFRRGLAYGVRAVLPSGAEEDLRFTREGGALAIDLGRHRPEEVDHLDVSWPSDRLARMTLIDTPGLESLDEQWSARTRVLLGIEEEGHSQVDAVVYLMRHLHRSDAEFLEAFMDRSLARPSPVNAVAVLSRADEIGAGRLDALESAAAIARRYAADDAVRSLCAAVVPVAGLIAETGLTLREEEMAHLRALADTETAELEGMLLSVERFCAPGVGPLTAEYRRDLLLRLGLFGVRLSLREIREGRAVTAGQLARTLVAASGIEGLTEVLDGHLARRSTVLKARSALIGLRALARNLAGEDPAGAEQLIAAVERVEAGAHELAELRLLHLLLTGAVTLPEEEQQEVARLAGEGDPAERLGLPAGSGVEAERAVALQRLEDWRRRAAHPLTDRVTAEACEVVAHSYERLYSELSTTP
ncbi:MAG TPA: dynamin family protein [Acidimicrobiia bacterium]|nr:dynamin family protein [Acidimicrobiia bacterium]